MSLSMKFTAAFLFATFASASARNCSTMREEIDPILDGCDTQCFDDGTMATKNFSGVADIIEVHPVYFQVIYGNDYFFTPVSGVGLSPTVHVDGPGPPLLG